MTRPAVSQTWYRIALALGDGKPAVVAAEGEHLGIAVAAAERHERDTGAYAIAAEVASGDHIPLGESVGKDRVVAQGAAEHVSTFRWPSGVLPEFGHEVAAQRGYAIHPDPDLLVVEAQTDREHLVDLFLGLIERLPAADNLEVRVLDHFENTGQTDVWLTSRVDGKRIISFLDDHEVELIGNGHVELSIYVRRHKATLRLTEHKTVVWLAERGELSLETELTGWLRELETPRLEQLVTVTDAPHFHYRAAKSRDRKKLSDHLFRQRLRRVDKLKTST